MEAEKWVQKPTHQNEPSGWQNPRLQVLRSGLVSSESPSSLSSGFVEIQFTPHTIHTFQVFNLVVFRVFTELWLTTTILEHFHDPQRTLSALAVTPHPPHCAPHLPSPPPFWL